MILVDTSVWVDHLSHGNAVLTNLLNAKLVLMHPFVLGEIACGSVKQRSIVLNELATMKRAAFASHEETMNLLETRALWARGVGWIDFHLLASALLTRCEFWTLDLRLQQAASVAGVTLYGRTH